MTTSKRPTEDNINSVKQAPVRLRHVFEWIRIHKARTVTPKLRFQVLKRDGFRCQYCGGTAKTGAVLQVDHIKPRALGGKHLRANLVTACRLCNLGKGAEPL